MYRRSQHWIFLLGVAAFTLAADRVTKTIVVNRLTLYETWHPPIPLVRSIASLTYTTNTGAAFGLFPNQGYLFIGIAFVVITAMVFYYRHLPSGYGLTRLALGLQLGGALGNLIDRLRQGYVVDFIDFNFWPMQHWPIWNLADASIVVGVGILAVTMWLEGAEDPNNEIGSSEGDAASEPGTSS